MTRLRHKKYKLDEIARQIENARKSPVGQPAEFDAFLINHVLSVVESAIDFQPQVAEIDRRNVIWNAISTSVQSGTIDAQSLLQQLQQAEDDYLRQQEQDFVLATSITIRYSQQVTRMKVNNSTLTFTPEFPIQYKREPIFNALKKMNLTQPDELCCVRVRVKTRTIRAATEKALWSLDLVRGFWNYSYNQLTRMRYAVGGREQPVNAILLGPIHTLHHINGSLATENYWYELDFSQHTKVFNIEKHWPAIVNWTTYIRHRLQLIGYSEEICSLFVRYTRALDTVNHSVAFNKLWSVLEHLTGSVGNYDQLISRTIFLVKPDERAYLCLVLEHLRDIRNGFVHDDKARRDTSQYVYQLKWFVEILFKYHLHYGKSHKTLKTACSFLDLPKDVNTIQEQIKNFQEALKFQQRSKS